MKKIILIILTLMMITTVTAIDTADWKTVTVENHDFKVPPQYSNGEMKKTGYIFDNWRVFQITEPGESLPTMYGYAIDNNEEVEDLDINGHPVKYIKQYYELDNGNLSRAFFACGDSVYLISWLSDNFTEEVKETIATSDPSELSNTEFHDILDDARLEYEAEKLAEEKSYYNTPPKKEHNYHHSMLPFYYYYSRN